MAVDIHEILYQFTAANQLTPVAKQVVAELQAIEVQTGKVDAELQRLGLSTRSSVQTLTQHAQTLTQVSTQTQKNSETFKKSGEDNERGAEQFARGVASSVFNFGLLAGATVETGHLVGEFLTDSVEKFQELNDEVEKISALNPRINADTLFGQITSLEQETGVLSQKLTSVFELAAQAARGNQQQTLDLTKELATGAQGVREDPTAWTQAALASMNAYGLKISDIAHIQDVLTLALQNSAGQGKAFIDNVDQLTQSGSQAHLSLEGVAAGFETIAQHGGDATRNAQGFKQIINTFALDTTKDKLHELGIATEDSAGNVRDLSAVWQDLSEKLKGLSPATQDSILSQIVPDKRSQAEFKVLLGDMDTYNALLGKSRDEQGASKEAADEFAKSEEGVSAKIDGTSQAIEENIGKFLDWKRHLAGIIEVATGDDTPQKEQQQSQNPQQPAWLQADMGAQAHAITQNLADMNAQTEKAGGYFNSVGDSISRVTGTFGDAVTVTKEYTQAEIEASQAAQVFADWNGKILSSSSALVPQLAGVSAEVNALYQDSQKLTQGDSFGGFGSELEQKIAGTSEELKKTDIELRALQDIKPPGTDTLLGQLSGFALGSQIDQLTQKVKTLQDQLRGEASQTPEAQKATTEFGQFTQQQGFTARQTQEQQALNDVTDAYTSKIKSLTDEQRALQIELRDDSTPQLTAARKELDAATRNLKDGTQQYADALDTLDQQLKRNKADEADAMAPLTSNLSDAKSALDSFNSDAQHRMDGLNGLLKRLQATEQETEAASTRFLAPYINSVNQATAALKDLEAETKRQDAAFDAMARPIQTDMDLMDRMAKITLDPLRAEVQKYQDQLYDLAQAEQAQLRPLEDSLYGQGLALRDAQDAVKALADKYAQELNPLLAEQNALEREKQAIQNQDTLHQEALGVENLAAQLANAKKGSADFIELSQQLAKAKNTQNIDQKLFSVQERIADITAERDAALDAAQKRADAAQKEYDQTQRQIDAIKHQYDTERQGIQDSLDKKSRELELDQRHFDAIHTGYQDQLDDIGRNKQAYDTAQTAKLADDQALLDSAQQELTMQEGVTKAINQTAIDAVTAMQNLIQSDSDAYASTRAELQTNVADAQAAYDKVKAFYDNLTSAIGLKITAEQTDASEFAKAAQSQLDTAKTKYQDLRDAIQLNINKIGDQITAEQNTASESEKAAKRIIDAQKLQQDAIVNTIMVQNALNNLIASGGTLPAGWTPPVGVKLPPGYGEGAPPKSPGEPRTPTPPDGIGGRSVTVPSSTSNIQLPVSSRTLQGAGAGAGSAHIGALHVNLGGINVQGSFIKGDPKDEASWYEVGEAAFRGINEVLGSKYGVEIQVAPR